MIPRYWCSFLGCLLLSCTFELGTPVKTSASDAPVVESESCQSLRRSHRWWGGASYGALALSGTSGLSTIPTDKPTATWFAIGAVGMAALGSVAQFEDGTIIQEYQQKCEETPSK